jgi:hypothetical protein
MYHQQNCTGANRAKSEEAFLLLVRGVALCEGVRIIKTPAWRSRNSRRVCCGFSGAQLPPAAILARNPAISVSGDLRKRPRLRLDLEHCRALKTKILERDGWKCQL